MKKKTTDLSPYRIAITGTTRGIGEQLLKQFTEDPACERIYCLSRHNKNLTKHSINTKKCIFVKIDLLKPTSIKQQIEESALANEKHLNFLINNAGLLTNKPFNELRVKEAMEMFAVNYFSPLELIHTLAGRMCKVKPRHIVNISSMAGVQGSMKFPGLVHYGASKAALASATEILAEELKEQQISINCLALGSVDTHMFTRAFPQGEPQTDAQTIAEYIYSFVIQGWKVVNGKIFPISITTP